MKSEAMGVGTALSKKDLKELMSETKETLAVDLKNCNNGRTFNHVDLWNLQKRQKLATGMRRRLM
jgi:NifB/MoaA-like Fe-S oxidoreductase